jgi:hypothetical protein
MKPHLEPFFALLLILGLAVGCSTSSQPEKGYVVLSKEVLQDKIKGAWAAQTIGVTYGGPMEFRYQKKMIPDSVVIPWSDTTLNHWMTQIPGLYDDIYMDLTFVEVMEKEGIDAPASAHAAAYAKAKYWLWHANQQGRYNILHGIVSPESGHWKNNPHADDIDFQIESDFAGIMSPGMPNAALAICDRIGHIMNYGDGYYGGVLMANMYCYAFLEKDIPTIVNKGLAAIPKESTFYQCIADVVKWHQQYPNDWKKTWQQIEDKWGVDIGCPDGAFSDFNIDAKMNAAYVVLGLLYGNGDLGKTMEFAARAGQDADCNPSSAAAIVGTVIGYKNLPKKWTAGLKGIEDLDFKYTHTSLNKVYSISYNHALALIEKNGGKITDKEVKIKLQETTIAPLEQCFPGYALGVDLPIKRNFLAKDKQELEIPFEGIGVVLSGRARIVGMDKVYALIEPNETFNDYRINAEFYIDGKFSKKMEFPLYFIERAHELFFQYELPEGKHTLKMKILNPNPKVFLEVNNLLTYKKSTGNAN